MSYKTHIEDLIRNSDYGKTPSQIAKQLSIAWRTVEKYLKELVKERRVVSHEIGPYTIYTSIKQGEPSLYQILYLGSIMVGEAMVQQGGQTQGIPEVMQKIWRQIGDQAQLPFEEEIPRIQGPPTTEFLDSLIDVIKRVLSEFGYLGNYPKVETLPQLGIAPPLTRFIRLTDPGFIHGQAEIHYYLLASLLEVKLSNLTGTNVFFHVVKIQAEDEVVYFEIGLIENYLVDISVFEQKDKSQPTREFLDFVKNVFPAFAKTTKREYMSEGITHYELKFLQNQQVEIFLSMRAKALRENVKIVKKYNIRPTRQYLPIEDWPAGITPYVVIQIVTNFGNFFDDFLKAMMEVFPVAGYCIHFERITGGIRMCFLEKEDFEIVFGNPMKEKEVREKYKFFGITSEDFFRERKQIQDNLLLEIQSKLAGISNNPFKNQRKKN